MSSARAFCGFYVTGADASLYANATMVVLMRDGMRTVLSMQNNYQGPPEGFALVIPVPSVLQKQQVQTLSNDVFKHVDTLGAPRLVEYWETDLCEPWTDRKAGAQPTADTADAAVSEGSVTVEAQFKVGEYDIVILSANDSSGLERWLIKNDYNIPMGAKDVLDPYVAAGTQFFVAKVDPSKVMFKDGQAALSPLRFYYDAAELSLPVRLGLLNSQGTQDLIVSVLAPSRYELANHPNVRTTWASSFSRGMRGCCAPKLWRSKQNKAQTRRPRGRHFCFIGKQMTRRARAWPVTHDKRTVPETACRS